MTATQENHTPVNPGVSDTADTPGPNTSEASSTVTLAGLITSENFPRADLAQLRRMDPDSPDAAFRRLMKQQDLSHSAEAESKWALIIHGIALMTPANNGNDNLRTAHHDHAPVGRALYLGSESHRKAGFYSEPRFNRLMTSRGPVLRTLLIQMFQMMASDGVTFNWREMASFILSEGHDDEAAEQSRRRMARRYYQAMWRNTQTST